MQLSIIIPTKDRGDIFNKTLSCAIKATAHIQAEIIIVNDSRTGRPDVGKFSNANIKLLDNPKAGVASARNMGAKLAVSDLLLFLDDDIQITRSSVDQMLTLHAQLPNACLNPNWVYPAVLQEALLHRSFGRYLIKHNLVSFKGWYNQSRWKDNDIFESPLVASFHLSISKQNFDRAGGYDEVFPHAGFEDYDFPVRLRNLGMNLLIDTRSTVYHNEEDRLELKGWLRRQVRGNETRRIGVRIGYDELAIHYPPARKGVFQSLRIAKPLLIGLAGLVPNSKIFDVFYFRLVSTLQAICIFEGYHNT